MALYKKAVPKFVPNKDLELNWDNFSGGWNNLFKPTELRGNELAQADNLMLIGKGTPTGRWGSAVYNLAGTTGRVRLLDAYYNSLTSTNLLLAITDQGYLTQKNGASYTIITGASFASGTNYQSTQLGNNTYIAAASQGFLKFNGSALIPYTAISNPTNVSLVMLSYVSGFNTYSWLVTATSATGETLTSPAKSLASLPLDLTSTAVRVTWNAVNASLTGYNIYRGTPGNETYIASVDPTATQYIDTGAPSSDTLFPPLVDTTGGVKAKYILKYDDRLVLAGVAGDPSRVYMSGRYPYHDRFTAIDGGGYTYVTPNDGDDITGLGLANIQSQQPLLVVYKNNSTHIVTIGTITLGGYSILDMNSHVLTNSAGVSSGDTVVGVENDTFSFGKKGLYSTGQEPSYLNQIRTNEISARIRTYIQNLSESDLKEASAFYADYKYVLSFPTLRETVIYDRQRGAFMGPWKTPFGVTKWLRYFDGSGVERYLAGTDIGPYIREFSSSYITDSGTAIAKVMRTKKEDLGNWSIMKMLKYFYFLLRNVRGSVTVNLRIEERSGNTVTTKTATITSQLGDGGWGGDMWGNAQFGQTDATIVLSGDELARYSLIYKQFRVVQVEVTASAANSNFEFLGIRMTAQGLGSSSLPSSLKV